MFFSMSILALSKSKPPNSDAEVVTKYKDAWTVLPSNFEDFALLIDYMKISCIDIVKGFQIYRRVIKHKINPCLFAIF